MWLATRPYSGTVLDARFYMVEALNALDPSSFAGDLYFKFGSQGSFSFFTNLYLPLLRALGVGTTGMVLTIAGQLFWLFALFRLTRSLVGDRLLWLSVAAVVGMMHIYAGGFGYGEGYVTARPFAEAFVMLALALLSSRPLWTVILLALSAAIHPLMTLPGIAFALVYMALGRPVWWAAMAAGLGAGVGLALAGVEPFSNLLRTIDPEWFAVVDLRSMHVLLANWPADSFMQILGIVAWAVAAWVLVGQHHRRFLGAALIVGVGGLACTYLGGDLARNVLVVELQPWRSLWLLQLISRIYIPLVLMAVLARTNLDSFRWAALLTMGLILTAAVTRLVRNPYLADFTLVSLVLVIAGLAVMAAQLLLAEQKYRRVALVIGIAGLALIPIALSRWDMRSPWTKYVESPAPPPKDLAVLLPAGASVYWEGGIEMLWLRMKRASYFSCDQGTGVVFHRETAMAYKQRAASFWPLRTGDFRQSADCAILDKRPKRDRTRAGLQAVCTREPELDYLVLTAPLDGVQPKVWKSPVRFEDIHLASGMYYENVTDRFYIYSCASVR